MAKEHIDLNRAFQSGNCKFYRCKYEDYTARGERFFVDYVEPGRLKIETVVYE